MEINVTKEKVGYSAVIKKYGIVTQGDNLDELILNIIEAVGLVNEGDKKNIGNFKEFSLVL